jgi:hypothetical protein
MYDVTLFIMNVLRELAPKIAEDGSVVADEDSDGVTGFITRLLTTFIKETLNDK